MRLLNVCPFRVGDAVYWKEEPEYHTAINRVHRYCHNEFQLWFTDLNGIDSYWFVDITDPNHSGIRLVKRGE